MMTNSTTRRAFPKRDMKSIVPIPFLPVTDPLTYGSTLEPFTNAFPLRDTAYEKLSLTDVNRTAQDTNNSKQKNEHATSRDCSHKRTARQ